MNIADYYINGLPEIGEWRDMHARIEGESVQELQRIFLRMWKKSTGEEINGQIYYPNNEDTLNIYEEENIAIVDRHPTKTSKVMRRVYAKAIETANNKVQIINPYFTPQT